MGIKGNMSIAFVKIMFRLKNMETPEAVGLKRNIFMVTPIIYDFIPLLHDRSFTT